MKQDHHTFTASRSRPANVAGAYADPIAERIRRFQPMVRKLAWHVHGTGRPGLELEDLMQAGLVALTECAQRHEGPGEDGFAAYAKLRVRGAMVDLVRRNVPNARIAADRRKRLQGAQVRLRGSIGREPSAAEIASELGIDPVELAAWDVALQPVRTVSLDDAYSDQSGTFADDAADALSMLEDGEMRAAVVAAITDLPDRLKLIVQLYFVEELNLSEIAEVLQVSIPRVHQLKAQALLQLREALSGFADVI